MKNLIKSPMYLEDFLKEFGSKIRSNIRLLYVLEPNMEKGKLTKFGIAGMVSGNGYGRLNEYKITYGENDNNNSCKGVRIFYCGITEYNRLVEAEKSQVYKVEKRLKATFKSTTEPGRGAERTSAKPEEVIKAINKILKKEKDTETNIVRDARETTKKYRNDKKAYKDDPVRRSERLAKKN